MPREEAIHEDLRELCGDIVSSQTMEQEQMQAWLSDWYGVGEYEPRMKPSQMRQMAELAALSGEDFEMEFLQEMIGHHRKAVKEGNRCVRRAAHRELVQLCESIIQAQQAEIELMSAWLCEWYGRCR